MTTKVAFLFPGQGSQAVGMGADVYTASAAAQRVFEAVDEVLGFSLSTLAFKGPDESLRETINAQPAIVTVSLALLAAFQEALSPPSSSWSTPLVPSFTAGHSIGEYAALVAAGALDLKSAALLVRERGRLMHREGTVCPGGMAAVIGMDAEDLQAICQEATGQALASLDTDAAEAHPGQGRVIVANYNAPGQVVISGEQQALDRAMELARARGAKRVLPLAVSGAFHSPVMQPAAHELARFIASTRIEDARIPVISNISAQPLHAAQEIRQELASQVASSVQWTRTIERLLQAGVTVFIEIGPGQALSGMLKRIAKGVSSVSISSMADIAKACASVCEIGLLDEV